MKEQRRLRPAGEGWEVETVPVEAETEPGGADTVTVDVESVLLPAGGGGSGLWAGRDATSPGSFYAGWGPAVDRLTAPRAEVLALAGDGEAAGLVLAATAIVAALDQAGPTTRPLVLGQGLLGELVEAALAAKGVTPGPQEEALDLVVDTTGDPAAWRASLSRLRGEATVLLLVPPWSAPVDVNFYPHLHKRSLRTVARRWHRPPPEATARSSEVVHEVVHEVVRRRWVEPLRPGAGPSRPGAWLQHRWEARGD